MMKDAENNSRLGKPEQPSESEPLWREKAPGPSVLPQTGKAPNPSVLPKKGKTPKVQPL